MPVSKILSSHFAGALFTGALACAMATPFAAQSTSSKPTAPAAAASGYNQPPKNILDVMLAPTPPEPVVSPTHDSILLVTWQWYPSIARVATPYLRLAGVRVEPKNHSRHDTPGGYGITECATGFDLVHTADGDGPAAPIHVALSAAACPGEPIWAADGKHFAFVNLATESVELWIGEAKTGAVHRVPGARLNPMFDDAVQWMPDQKTLLVKLVPKGLGAPPPEPIVPLGPSIQETTGEKGQSSTYENRDTLNNTHDEDLFDYYGATQLALIDAATSARALTRRSRPSASPPTTKRCSLRPTATICSSPSSTSPTLTSPPTTGFPRKSKSGTSPTAPISPATPSRPFRWPIAFPFMAFE